METYLREDFRKSLEDKTKIHLLVKPSKRHNIGDNLKIQCGTGADKVVVKAKITAMQQALLYPSTGYILIDGKQVDAELFAKNNGLPNAAELFRRYPKRTTEMVIQFTDFSY